MKDGSDAQLTEQFILVLVHSPSFSYLGVVVAQ